MISKNIGTVLTVEQQVSEFIGIYDADSTLIGEVKYWIGARLGRTHCSLCDLTHGLFTVKSEWRSCIDSLDVSFQTFHRDDAPTEALDVAAGNFPIVLARYGDELQIVFTHHQLDEFNGDTHKFHESLSALIQTL